MKLTKIQKHRMPIVITDDGINCLIDTGADIPVWVGNIKFLLKLRPKWYGISNCYAVISGFGGKGIRKSSVICFDELTFENKNLCFYNTPVAVKNLGRSSYDLILPGTMFSEFTIALTHGERYVEGIEVYSRKFSRNFGPDPVMYRRLDAYTQGTYIDYNALFTKSAKEQNRPLTKADIQSNVFCNINAIPKRGE